jgi:hypothetical protein
MQVAPVLKQQNTKLAEAVIRDLRAEKEGLSEGNSAMISPKIEPDPASLEA